MADIHKGRCQCGAVEYEFTGSPQTIHACHCSECQKRSGSAFGLTMVVNRKNFTITSQVSTYVRAAIAVKRTRHIFAQTAVILSMVR